MKKQIIIGTILMLLLMASSLAFSMPHPVLGVIKADGYPVSNLEVEVKNIVTGTEQITTTNNNGQYQVDLGNTNPPYYEGNTIKVTISYCGDFNYCSKTEVLNGGYTRLSFDVAEANIPDTAKIIKYVCWDGSSVDVAASCPAKEEPEPASDLFKILMAVAFTILGVFGWGKSFLGLAKYWMRQGELLEAAGKKAEAKKCYDRAAKMVKTSLTRAAEGYYNK